MILTMILAKEAFLEVGEELKRRRLCDFVSNIGCHLTDDIDFDNSDPATSDEILRAKLIQNQQIGKRRLEEVISVNVKQRSLDSKFSFLILGARKIFKHEGTSPFCLRWKS